MTDHNSNCGCDNCQKLRAKRLDAIESLDKNTMTNPIDSLFVAPPLPKPIYGGLYSDLQMADYGLQCFRRAFDMKIHPHGTVSDRGDFSGCTTGAPFNVFRHPPLIATLPIGPHIVATDANADEMNKLYGDRYGFDWEYPIAEQPVAWCNANGLKNVSEGRMGTMWLTKTDSSPIALYRRHPIISAQSAALEKAKAALERIATDDLSGGRAALGNLAKRQLAVEALAAIDAAQKGEGSDAMGKGTSP